MFSISGRDIHIYIYNVAMREVLGWWFGIRVLVLWLGPSATRARDCSSEMVSSRRISTVHIMIPLKDSISRSRLEHLELYP